MLLQYISHTLSCPGKQTYNPDTVFLIYVPQTNIDMPILAKH